MKRNIILVSNDVELQSIFERTGIYNKVSIASTLELDQKFDTSDILVISDKSLSMNQFLDHYSKFSKKVFAIFFLVSDPIQYPGISNVLSSKEVNVIPPKLTKKQIVERICQATGEDIFISKNVITFFGASHGVGTTITAQGVAECLADNTNKTIGFLCLNGKPGIDYVKTDSDIKGIDDIRAKVINNIISRNELLEVCINKKNLYVLPGAFSIADVRHYHPEHVEGLIEFASQVFDIVIVDGGCDPCFDIAMGIGSLNATNMRYLVTTQQNSVHRHFERINNQILSVIGINIKDFFLIVNKYLEDDELYSPYQIADIYNMHFLCDIPYVNYGWHAEKNNKTLYSYGDEIYVVRIQEISRVIAKQLNVEFNQAEVKKKGFLRRLFGVA